MAGIFNPNILIKVAEEIISRESGRKLEFSLTTEPPTESPVKQNGENPAIMRSGCFFPNSSMNNSKEKSNAREKRLKKKRG